ncbi:D,L-glycerol 3-phosphate phosphatase [Austwickia sp. TVS 96-490-7B]|uniref:HAD-IIA family hydrolase n=1 Tax=Austwickia sp. TVS 96-490-7B TaxID=2830843 RepID=UPI001C5865E8|nr:HAD-IIA family hydrolase [Austwickia sp. TVS 96-490-7B]MBW3086970.1 D,L-glycerol 3-phosphate phosphatase [Austwickia sp. TVS 96-490-7B]
MSTPSRGATQDLSAGTLLDGYRGIVCDLDGVVYRGAQAIPYAVASLETARERGLGIVYATNNGSRPPEDVAEHLSALGLQLTPDAVLTSAQAAAAHLFDQLGPGSPILALGGPGVPLAIHRAHMVPITTSEHAAGAKVVGVLQSYGATVSWTDLAEAAYAINGGALWVASNADLTIPTARGIAPGNGSLVAAVRQAVTVDPVVVGKPEAPLYHLSAATLGSDPERTLGIGDRIDTDIDGASAAGIPSLLVLTGVSGLVELAAATGGARPRYLAMDLRSLHRPYDDPTIAIDAGKPIVSCNGTHARYHNGLIDITGTGDPDELLRAVVHLSWYVADHESAVDPADLLRIDAQLRPA